MGSERANLLILDGRDDIRESLSRMFAAEGYAVATATNADQALDRLQTTPFDVVICAASLTGLDGLGFLGQLTSEFRPARARVVMIAPENEGEIVIRALKQGVDEVVLEPIDPDKLKAKVKEGLAANPLRTRLEYLEGRLQKLRHDLIEVILPVGIALSAEKNLDRLLERIVLEGKAICNSDGGTMYLRTKENSLRFVIMHTDSLGIAMGGTTGKQIHHNPLNLYDPVSGQPNHHNVATHVALQGETINIADVYYAEGFDFFATRNFDKNNNYRTISCLTVPLKDNSNNVIGVLQLINAKDPESGQVICFDPYLQLVSESLASQAAVALNNQLLLQREKELSKFERDIQIGRQMQADFLPAELPSVSNWEIAAFFQPAREVSGDFYDSFVLMDGARIALVIADVCDKGVGAALFMSLIRSLIRAFSEQHYELLSRDSLTDERSSLALQNAVLATNNYIANNHARMNMFATLFFGVLDPTTGSLIYVNGGHEAPVLIGSDGVKSRLKQTGPAVGMLPDMNFKVEKTSLHAGEMLFAYTDGVPEARSPEKGFFTEQRLLTLLGTQIGVTASTLLKFVEGNLLSHIAAAEQFDDITMLAVRRD